MSETKQVSATLEGRQVEFLDEQVKRLGLESRAGAVRYAVTLWMEKETYTKPMVEELLRDAMGRGFAILEKYPGLISEFGNDESSESTGAKPPRSGAEVGGQ